jgi:hypothetical protein
LSSRSCQRAQDTTGKLKANPAKGGHRTNRSTSHGSVGRTLARISSTELCAGRHSGTERAKARRDRTKNANDSMCKATATMLMYQISLIPRYAASAPYRPCTSPTNHRRHGNVPNRTSVPRMSLLTRLTCRGENGRARPAEIGHEAVQWTPSVIHIHHPPRQPRGDSRVTCKRLVGLGGRLGL